MDEHVIIFTPHYRIHAMITLSVAIVGGWFATIYLLVNGIHHVGDVVFLVCSGVFACCASLFPLTLEKRILFREHDILIEYHFRRMSRLHYHGIRDIGRNAIITTQPPILPGMFANADELIDILCEKIQEGKIEPQHLEGKLRVKPWSLFQRIAWRQRSQRRRERISHHHGVRINVRSDLSGWSIVHTWFSRFKERQEEKMRRWQRVQEHLDKGRIQRVETILAGISYQKWVGIVREDDILFYISAKPHLLSCHMVLINAICRYPFTRKKHVIAICQTFHELLLGFDAYHQTDVLSSLAGFFEAVGFTPIIHELTWRRNYFLQNGLQKDDHIIMVLDHAITHLMALGWRRIAQKHR